MNEQEADDDTEQMSLIFNRFYSDSSLREFIEEQSCATVNSVSDLVIQIFFCLQKLEKHINLGENVLTFLLNNNIADTNLGILSVTASCKEKFTWMVLFLFLGLWVLSCLIRCDGLSFVVLFVTNQIQTCPKGAGADNLLRLRWQSCVGRKRENFFPPALPPHAFFLIILL